MRLAGSAHGRLVHPRRVRVLAEHAARLLPHGARVLDVGSGDGWLAAEILQLRPDLRIEGIDVLVRASTSIPVGAFDGRVVPFADDSVDVVTFFDVLHHARDPMMLLREAVRVARGSILIKDHVADSRLSRAVLGFMDDVSNRRHGVALPHTYWSSEEWARVLDHLAVRRAAWHVGGLGLYPWPASLVFGGRLHVLASLAVVKPGT
jgi:SAM-dependent methyltransferase